jgi:hypothetical protein
MGFVFSALEERDCVRLKHRGQGKVSICRFDLGFSPGGATFFQPGASAPGLRNTKKQFCCLFDLDFSPGGAMFF